MVQAKGHKILWKGSESKYFRLCRPQFSVPTAQLCRWGGRGSCGTLRPTEVAVFQGHSVRVAWTGVRQSAGGGSGRPTHHASQAPGTSSRPPSPGPLQSRAPPRLQCRWNRIHRLLCSVPRLSLGTRISGSVQVTARINSSFLFVAESHSAEWMDTTQLVYPFTCLFTLRRLLVFGCYKQSCSEHLSLHRTHAFISLG